MLLSREAYVIAKVLVSLDELRDHGYVAGGLTIDRNACQAAVAQFEAAGNAPMTKEEMLDAVAFLKKGGQMEVDFPESAYGIVFELIDRLQMLQFLLSNFQMHSPKMNGEHSWRFRGGWPMTHAIGPDPETAVGRAMAEVWREKSEA